MEKDDATILTFCHLAVAVIVFLIASRALESLGVTMGWGDRYEEWYGTGSTLLSIIISAGLVWYLRAKETWSEYHLSAIAELRKVKWPSFDDTKKMTRIVVIVVGIFGVVVAAFDYLWSQCLRLIIL